jgi:MFS family permease
MGAATQGRSRTSVVVALGTTQTISWASSYYIPAVLAVPMARELGVPNAWVFAAFSGALVVTAILGPLVGRKIDLLGGRLILTLSHVVLALGLVLLAAGYGTWSMVLGWGVLGIGMAMGLYDAAFAALAGYYGRDARAPMTGITLIAGFASTIGWPIHAVLEQVYGWRTACLFWAVVHVVICLPISLLLLPAGRENSDPEPDEAVATAVAEPEYSGRLRRTTWLLAMLFAAAWFVTGAMATHLPRLLQELGATPAAAIAAAALVGPAQVAARLVEFSVLRSLHPLVTARIATVLHPAGAAVLVLFGAPGAAAFALLHGAGNGMLTVARGVLPLALFGATGYGFRQGLISAPARMTQATSPFLFALVLDASAISAVVLSSALMALSLAMLLALRRPAA